MARRKRKKIDTMQVTETLAEGLKHEFKVSVPASDLDAKAGAKLVDLKDKVKLNGFRPGKVPVSHLKKVYGRSVMAETIDQTIRDTNTQIFTDRGFRLRIGGARGACRQQRCPAFQPHAQRDARRVGALLGFDRGSRGCSWSSLPASLHSCTCNSPLNGSRTMLRKGLGE